jgi:hypothetical protein
VDELDTFTHGERHNRYRLVLPVATWLVVVAIVCGLLLAGVLQGHEARGPGRSTTTQSTILLNP